MSIIAYGLLVLQRSLPADGLTAAYRSPVPYTRDGLLLLHKEGIYQGGLVPTALLWKDGHCSRYAIDTEPDGSVAAQQVGVLGPF